VSTETSCESCYFGDLPDCPPASEEPCPYYSPLRPEDLDDIALAEYAAWMVKRIEEYEERLLDGFDSEVLEELKAKWLLYRRD